MTNCKSKSLISVVAENCSLKSTINCNQPYYNKCKWSTFAYQIKRHEFRACFRFQDCRGPNSLSCTWRRARLRNKVLSRRQEILEDSNNVMTMFITFTVSPGCTSVQHQALVRPWERKPGPSWQPFASTRCYHISRYLFTEYKNREGRKKKTSLHFKRGNGSS